MVRRMLLCAVIAAAAWLSASPATAHTSLHASTPAAGSVVHPELDAVELVFSSDVQAALSTVVLVGPDGEDVTSGSPAADGPRLVQPVTAPLAVGDWTVSYRVVAADGHPVTGSLPFQVGAGPAPSQAGAEGTRTGAPAVAADADVSRAGARRPPGLLLAAAGLSGAALVGLGAARRGRRPAQDSGA